MRPPALLVAIALLGVIDAGCATTHRPVTPVRTAGPPPVVATVPTTAPPRMLVPVPRSWLSYQTAVEPDSPIAFATPEVGWRLTGQESGVDQDLGAGPTGGEVFPGNAVEGTVDGGRSWTTIDRVPTGVWGLDLLSARVGIVVGVTTLWRTEDAGRHWTPLGEPAAGALVWASFSTPDDADGLTTDGTMVATADGGRTWSVLRTPAPLTAACFASAQASYGTDADGDLYVTGDGGGSWALARQGPDRIEQFYGPGAEISCSGPEVMVGLQYICGAACGAGHPYLVERSTDRGRTWTGPRPSTRGLPGAMNAVFGAVATDPEVSLLAAMPDENSEPVAERDDVALLVASGARYSRADEPALPGPPSPYPATYEDVVLGLALHGPIGWLYLLTHPGRGGSSRSVVWTTSDAGRTWTQESDTPAA